MGAVLLKALSFVLLIAAGFLLRRAGLFGERDYQILVRIVMNLTLPAAVITNFAGLELSGALLFVVLLGLLSNLALFGLGWWRSRSKPAGQRAFSMMNLPGYNIGTFAMPYMQSFLGHGGVVIACLFDTGNAIMCTGGSYALCTAAIGGDGGRPRLRDTLKKLFTSVPFDVYLFLLAYSALGLKVPQVALTLLAPLNAANPGLAMLMIGLMFRWESKPGYLRAALSVVLARNLFALLVALGIYFFAPFPLEIKQVVAVILFAPISVIAPAFTERCGGDAGLAGFTNSLSIVVSLLMMTGLMLALGIA
ncbi:MAG: transporter [Clostridiales bacterium]|uniref:AEC family transporter n=1 Tax=Oscillospiraceae TaxID=216572 RepID=UPI0009A8A167|nr:MULTISPECIES: hypothetical protein [Oscillospiraceae]PWM37621.1 MAG: transporter [Clostridiales bacterium]RGB66768.1 AEC family transporter [Harryflintia acetispora]